MNKIKYENELYKWKMWTIKFITTSMFLLVGLFYQTFK